MGYTFFFFFFFNDTATTEIYTLSLHDALPIGSQLRSGRPRTSCCNLSMAIPSRKARSRGSDQAFGSLSCPASGHCLGVPSFRGRPLPTIRIRPPACPHARDKPALLWQMRLPWPSRAEREKNAEQPVTLPRCVHPIGAGVGVS